MSDAPFRGTADPLGARLQRYVIPRPPPAPNVRTPYAIAASALSALGAVAGQLSMAVAFGAIGVIGIADLIKGRRAVQPATNADVHERGLRAIADVAWADVLVVTIDATPDQGPLPATLTIATRDATTAIAGHADDLGRWWRRSRPASARASSARSRPGCARGTRSRTGATSSPATG